MNRLVLTTTVVIFTFYLVRRVRSGSRAALIIFIYVFNQKLCVIDSFYSQKK